MNKVKANAKTRMLNALKTGRDISTKQARSNFGIQNVAARIYELREDGLPIFTDRKVVHGRPQGVYYLGTFPKTARTRMAKRKALTASA